MSGEEINEQIAAVGEEIRELKASKADKTTIDGKVATRPSLRSRRLSIPVQGRRNR
jgi:uncharacterized small protein (DUF1192 family)